jgi:hypothetical protein
MRVNFTLEPNHDDTITSSEIPHTRPLIPTKSNQVIGPEQFGPSLWQGLHYITLGYPTYPTPEQKQKYKKFFLLLQDTLPCVICARHYTENLKKLPLSDQVLENKESLVKWLIDFHNVVNKMNNKLEIPYKKARKMIEQPIHCRIEPETNHSISNPIEQFTEPYDTSQLKTIYGIFGLFFVFVLVGIIYKKK